MPELRLLIGLTGPNAAGKGEVASRLIAAGFAYHSLSDVLRDELESAGVAPTRENLIAKGNELRAAHGAGVLAERVRQRLGARDIVDSIRNPAEVAALRQERGFVLVGVDAAQEVRFQRACGRARPGDPLTLEEFRSKEVRENSPDPREQQLSRTWALADQVLRNDGSLQALHDAVDAMLRRLSSGR